MSDIWSWSDDEFVTIGADAVFLHVLSTNQSAIDFYTKSGFKIVKREVGFYPIEGRLVGFMPVESNLKLA